MEREFAAIICPHCSNDDILLIETKNRKPESIECYCVVCSKDWKINFTGQELPIWTKRRAG